jgi:spore coat protein U-like protein
VSGGEGGAPAVGRARRRRNAPDGISTRPRKFRLKIAFASLSNSLLVELHLGAATARQRRLPPGQQGERGMLFRHRARLLLGAAAFAAVAILNAGSGIAQTSPQSGTMTVTASIQQSCTMGTISALAFGNVTPGTTKKNPEATINISCSLPGSINLDFGDGQNADGVDSRNMLRVGGSPGDLLRYQLFSNAGRTSQWNAPVSQTVSTGNYAFTVWGSVPGSLSGGKPVGNYQDSVTVTATF